MKLIRNHSTKVAEALAATVLVASCSPNADLTELSMQSL